MIARLHSERINMPHGSFGQRRSSAAAAAGAIKVVRETAGTHSAEHHVGQRVLTAEELKYTPVDDDLREWKRARKPNFRKALWRPLLLMSTLCFGIASLVLPDSVNDAVDWLLYAMTGVSLYSWIRSRRRADI
jgi:hypothetical protein